MSEVKERNDVAPLGLDFEWTEKLFGWWYKESDTWAAYEIEREFFFAVWNSLEDADAFLNEVSGGVNNNGVPYSQGIVCETSAEYLRAKTCARRHISGMILVDAAGKEIQRMYFR